MAALDTLEATSVLLDNIVSSNSGISGGIRESAAIKIALKNIQKQSSYTYGFKSHIPLKLSILAKLKAYLKGQDVSFKGYEIELLSYILIDYEPIISSNPIYILSYTKVEKVFTLFYRQGINTQKILYGLLLSYLNHYTKVTSNRYKNALKGYIKAIVHTDTPNMFFSYYDIVKAFIIQELNGRPIFTLDMARLNVDKALLTSGLLVSKALDTRYFCNAWVQYIKEQVYITDEKTLIALNCRYYHSATIKQQKLIMAKAISDTYRASKESTLVSSIPLEDLYIRYVFPLLPGSIFSVKFWQGLTYPRNISAYLIYNILKELIIDKPKYATLAKSTISGIQKEVV